MGIEKNGKATRKTAKKKTVRKKSSANKNQPTKKTATKKTEGLQRNRKKKQPKAVRNIKKAPPIEGTVEERWAKVLAECEASGHFMFVAFHLNGDQVRCYRRTNAFPPEDFETALDLLEADLTKEKEELTPPGRTRFLGRPKED